MINNELQTNSDASFKTKVDDPSLNVDLPHPEKFYGRGDLTFDGYYSAQQMIDYANAIAFEDRKRRK
jgi:hypothetical protein